MQYYTNVFQVKHNGMKTPPKNIVYFKWNVKAVISVFSTLCPPKKICDPICGKKVFGEIKCTQPKIGAEKTQTNEIAHTQMNK